jgi:hypothetical protein
VYFRRAGGKWIRSEPLESELGGDRTKTVNGLQLSYYGIDDDVIDRYASAGADARATRSSGCSATVSGSSRISLP